MRVQRQQLCIRSFLAEVHTRRAAILEHTATAREALHPAQLTLFAAYAADQDHPSITLPLRRMDTRTLEPIRFADHRRVLSADPIPYPPALVVTDHTDRLRGLLDRHGIRYRTLTQPARVRVRALRPALRPQLAQRLRPVQEARRTVRIGPGDVIIDLAQPAGRKALLLLDPRSTSSVFRYPDYAALVTPGADFFVYHATGGPP